MHYIYCGRTFQAVVISNPIFSVMLVHDILIDFIKDRLSKKSALRFKGLPRAQNDGGRLQNDGGRLLHIKYKSRFSFHSQIFFFSGWCSKG